VAGWLAGWLADFFSAVCGWLAGGFQNNSPDGMPYLSKFWNNLFATWIRQIPSWAGEVSETTGHALQRQDLIDL